MGKFPLVVLLASALSSCATPTQKIVYSPTKEHPKVVEFSFGGAFGEQGRYAADGIHVCSETYTAMPDSAGVSFTLKEQTQKSPSPKQWAEFWRTLDQMDLARWKSVYTPEDVGAIVNDGIQWQLTTSTLKGTSESRGDNAYPTPNHPKKTTLADASFKQLEGAFIKLLEAPNSLPHEQ
jgi:hypothetical protein